MTDIIVIIICSLCGFALGKYFEKRVKGRASFFDDLCKYISRFKVNLSGRQLERRQFDEEFAAECGTVFAEYLLNGKFRCSLTKEEKRLAEQFFGGLDAVNTEELKKHLDYYGYLTERQAESVSQKASKASVYPKLGILSGVMIGIVLI